MLKPLHDLLAKHSLQTPVTPNTSKPTRHGSQWLILKTWSMEGKEFAAATFGDFKTGLKESWESTDKKSATPEEIAAAKKHVDDLLALEKEAKEKMYEEVSIHLQKEFDTFASTGDTPYLRRKQIAGELYGARIKSNESGDPIVAVPLRDVSGKLWNYQRIYSQKLSKGDKFFSPSARIEGCFHVLLKENEKLSVEQPPERIYLVEGYATAVSVRMALGEGVYVVCAFNAANLTPVAVAIREAFSRTKIIVCADNDAYTVIQNKPRNIGLEKGRRAAGTVGGEIVWPVFEGARYK